MTEGANEVSKTVCKHCGQTLPGPLELDFKLGRSELHLVELIHRAGSYGIAADRLYRALYNDPIRDEPTSGMATMRTRISTLNLKLAALGYRIVGERTGSQDFGNYRLVHWGV